jgi:hypothetical protein
MYNMAIAFGESFNLSKDEIIKCIEKIYKLECVDENFRYEDVEVALYNNDYYVKPGESKQAFKREWTKIFLEVKDKRDDEAAVFLFMLKTVALIKRFFDEEHFENQMARRQISLGSRIKLKTHLSKLNKVQLLQFMSALVICKAQLGRFISEAASIAFFKGLDDKCRKKHANIPAELYSPEGIEFLRQHPFYYFEVLSAGTISDMLYEAIDLDVPLATTLAIKLYNCGYEAMLKYLNDKLNFNVKPIQVPLQTISLPELRASLQAHNPNTLRAI